MILNELSYPKEVYDPNNKKHAEIFRKFLQKYSWGTTGCPFVLEEPYLSIPDMIKDKHVRHYLKV